MTTPAQHLADMVKAIEELALAPHLPPPCKGCGSHFYRGRVGQWRTHCKACRPQDYTAAANESQTA